MIRKNRSSGFSLIEIMVVIMIVGILSSMAVPSFIRLRNKSRQSEARVQLSGLYTCMRAFSQEWRFFFGDFRDIGYRPEPGRVHWFVGFNATDNTMPTYTGPSGTGDNIPGLCVNNQIANGACFYLTGGSMPVLVQATAGPTGNVTWTTFEAQAVSNFDSDAAVDRWSITQTKAVTHMSSDD